MTLLKWILLTLLGTLPLFGAHFINHGHAVSLHPLKSARGVSTEKSVRYYADNRGRQFGVTDQLILSFSDEKLREPLIKRYNLRYLRKLSEHIGLYRVTSSDQTLDTANALAKEKGVLFAHPNFLIHKATRTADPYYKFLWHLKNREYPGADINVEEAWNYTKGKGVIAAIVDEGIDIDHDDLRENIIGFANYSARDPYTTRPDSKTGYWHGTACAGLMAAVENDTGVVGVAPESKFYAIRYSDSDVAQDIIAFHDLMEANVSVISNSWGSYTNLDAYDAIFKELATKGRNGKGILIFFAAGNDHKNLDTAGIDDESESPWVISIAASTERNTIASYSNYGSSIDFIAPGGTLGGKLVTTDKMGAEGYTDWNYNFNFAGTSAAAPIAAGVGILILAADPDLTRDEVLDIMRKTAVKIGDYPYDEKGWNAHAGYGLIDAGKAVSTAYRLRMQALGIVMESRIDNFVHVMFESVQNN